MWAEPKWDIISLRRLKIEDAREVVLELHLSTPQRQNHLPSISLQLNGVESQLSPKFNSPPSPNMNTLDQNKSKQKQIKTETKTNQNKSKQ
jgi:hypothetical protein